MSDTGFVFPGTASGFRGLGSAFWSNPDNIKTDIDTAASASIIGVFEETFGLAATNFDFSGIPVGSTIDGIEVEVGEYSSNEASAFWFELRLILADDSDGSENKSGDLTSLGSASDVTSTAGGATDKWGESISLADVQNSDWGCVVSAESGAGGDVDVDVEWLRMKVYFTEPAGEPTAHESWAAQPQRMYQKSGRF
jgi:hypothetical protein